uniref:Transmembrane inner ear expressed protein n=1 Tax=Cacopsylla melanoneura TaxID=428564 RepID=A0A8D9E0V3_9HEMI
MDALCEMEDTGLGIDLDEFLEKTVFGFRLWAILYGALGVISLVVVLLCCCVRFRIPRTKQEIEADYVRRQITRHFQKYLKTIQDSEMDEMDLQKALVRVKGVFDAEHQPSPSGSSRTEESGTEEHHSSRRDELHLRKVDPKKHNKFKLSNMIKSWTVFPSKVNQTNKPRELQV